MKNQMKNQNLITVLFLTIPLSISAWAQNGIQSGLPADGKDLSQAQAAPKNDTLPNDAKGAIKKAKVFFIEPKNKAKVSSRLKVKMGVEGMKVKAAGEEPDSISSGHHHLLIDSEPIAAGQTVPNDATHLHFGKGQSETEISLTPGAHTLTLQFADGAHRSYGPTMSETIHIQVK